jgi:hypothetical protein
MVSIFHFTTLHYKIKGIKISPFYYSFLFKNFHKLIFKVSFSSIIYSGFKSNVGAFLLSITLIDISYSLQIGSSEPSSILLSVNLILKVFEPIFND